MNHDPADPAVKLARERQAVAAMFGDPQWHDLSAAQQAAAIDDAATYLARVEADPLPEEWFS